MYCAMQFDQQVLFLGTVIYNLTNQRSLGHKLINRNPEKTIGNTSLPPLLQYTENKENPGQHIFLLGKLVKW